MNKETISFKMEDYTITLHRDEEESKEMEQKRMALYTDCLSKAIRVIVTKNLKGYISEQHFNLEQYRLKKQ